MTQIIALVTQEYVLLASDRRLTYGSGPRKGEVYDDDACKLVRLRGTTGIAYSGVEIMSREPRTPTRQERTLHGLRHGGSGAPVKVQRPLEAWAAAGGADKPGRLQDGSHALPRVNERAKRISPQPLFCVCPFSFRLLHSAFWLLPSSFYFSPSPSELYPFLFLPLHAPSKQSASHQ
jgi:hypothetical protein